MKKEVEIEVPAKKASVRKVAEFYCDVPGCTDNARTKPSIYVGGTRSAAKCSICKRDICTRHMVYDPDEMGDYPAKWCTVCYGLYYQRHREMEARHDKEWEALLAEVKEKSLKISAEEFNNGQHTQRND